MDEGEESEWLTSLFEANRSHLRSVAYRMLGSPSEADDALQEAWLRLSRADTSAVENLGGWLTTVTARVCLDMLRSRKSRREEPQGLNTIDPIASRDGGADPGGSAVLADSVGQALLVVLETLDPAERLAFVLHDMFAVPFEDIGPIVGRSPAAARQLASRARRRVQGALASTFADVDLIRQRQVVDAFLAASRDGQFEALLAVLDPDVVLRADAMAVKSGTEAEVRGAAAVAGTFSGRAKFAEPALVGGAIGAVWAPGGQPRVVFALTIKDDRIVNIDLVADPEHIGRLNVTTLT